MLFNVTLSQHMSKTSRSPWDCVGHFGMELDRPGPGDDGDPAEVVVVPGCHQDEDVAGGGREQSHFQVHLPTPPETCHTQNGMIWPIQKQEFIGSSRQQISPL